MAFSPKLLQQGASGAGGYKISRSLRFNSADSAYLNWTPSNSATSTQKLTYSCWVKRSTLAAYSHFGLSSAVSGSSRDAIRFNNDDTLNIYLNEGASFSVATTAVFRDVSAWYHIVVAVDTTQTTSSSRIRLYVNNVEQTLTGTQPTQNYVFTGWLVSGKEQNIGRSPQNAYFFGGYETEIYCIDGQQLTPSSFGSTNADTGVWQPKAYSGSYGTNGFYLNFSDNSNTTAATLGKDYSGNGNNWTPNNFSVTAGAGNDSLVDSPTSYGTDTGVGGTVRGNYCTINAVTKTTNMTLTNGNLDCVSSNTDWSQALGTIGMSSGKWYFEVLKVNASGGALIGIAGASVVYSASTYIYQSPIGYLYYQTGQKYNNNVDSAYGASYTAGDVVGVAFDADAGTLVFYKNGSSQGTAFSGLTNGPYLPAILPNNTTGNLTANFGQRPFAYTAPSGFKALCTQNLPTPTIGATTATQAGKFFGATAYSGTSATQAIVNDGFQPDLIWLKSRNAVGDNGLYDSIRGISLRLVANNTNAEASVPLDSFNSNGFSTTSNYNNSGQTLIAWQWRGGGTSVSSTSGSITSSVSASTTSGFSIVTYTGTGANATVGHGIGIAPSMVIIKARSFTQVWVVGHSSIGFGNYLLLNATDASASGSNVFNSTAPTSTVFSLGSGGGGNQSAATYVAYCFAPVAGYSAFGSYTGNGSADGPFIYTGFRPAFVMVKRTSSSGTNWQILDTKRSTYNVMGDYLYASASNAEAYDANVGIDSLSNGFKIKGIDGNTNTNSATYIYMAFAEFPFKFSLAR